MGEMKNLTLPATLEELETVQAFISAELEAADCPMKAAMQIQVAVEEIYVNMARYAYHPKMGEACTVGNAPLQVTIQFLDHGKPSAPLSREEADTTLSAEEREIGGLGIPIEKKHGCCVL